MAMQNFMFPVKRSRYGIEPCFMDVLHTVLHSQGIL